MTAAFLLGLGLGGLAAWTMAAVLYGFIPSIPEARRRRWERAEESTYRCAMCHQLTSGTRPPPGSGVLSFCRECAASPDFLDTFDRLLREERAREPEPSP